MHELADSQSPDSAISWPTTRSPPSRLSWLERLSVRHKLRGCASVGSDTRVLGRIWIHGEGSVHIGARVLFDARSAPIELRTSPGAEIRIGDDVTIGGGTSIEAERSILVSARSKVGGFCKIIDTHFHALTGNRNETQKPKMVIVEEDADIGARAILLAGAHVGRRTVVCPGSVITRRVPPDVTIGGLPATVRAKHGG
jgi:acetyltransferase-like isoleucine patch superfamily enzyme